MLVKGATGGSVTATAPSGFDQFIHADDTDGSRRDVTHDRVPQEEAHVQRNFEQVRSLRFGNNVLNERPH